MVEATLSREESRFSVASITPANGHRQDRARRRARDGRDGDPAGRIYDPEMEGADVDVSGGIASCHFSMALRSTASIVRLR